MHHAAGQRAAEDRPLARMLRALSPVLKNAQKMKIYGAYTGMAAGAFIGKGVTGLAAIFGTGAAISIGAFTGLGVGIAAGAGIAAWAKKRNTGKPVTPSM